jgi:hypothetical protein
MKLMNIIPAFLILVTVLQILPVRQAVKYFLIDNQTVEEIFHLEKGAAKNLRFLDQEQKLITVANYRSHHLIFIDNSYPFQFSAIPPLFHGAELPTPPPDQA